MIFETKIILTMKKTIFIISALCLAFALQAQNLTILHTNDTHSHIDPLRSGANTGTGGVIERAAYIDSVRAADGKKNVLLLDAGDFSQGSPYFTILKGDVEIDIINAMKYDAICLGNHEFDNGIEELSRRLSNLDCPAVCANYEFTGCSLSDLVRPYVIVRRGGLKIGIIGLLTDLTRVVDRDIAERIKYLEPAEVANKYAAYLKNEKKCDLIICLTHLGFTAESYTDQELAAQTRNVDLIVGGHSHTFLTSLHEVKDLDGKPVTIVTDGCWGQYVGNLKISEK